MKLDKKHVLISEMLLQTSEEPCTAKFTQTNMTGEMIQKLETEYNTYRIRNRYKDPTYEWDTYKDDDKRTKFYLGLPNFAILTLIFDFVSDYLNQFRRSLTKQQQLLVCLVKLRMNLKFIVRL